MRFKFIFTRTVIMTESAYCSAVHAGHREVVSAKLLPDVPKYVSTPRQVSVGLTLIFCSTTFWFLSGKNIHLYGGGTIDGNGQVWWDTLANDPVRITFRRKQATCLPLNTRIGQLQARLRGRSRALFP